jgi:hypothetical protein
MLVCNESDGSQATGGEINCHPCDRNRPSPRGCMIDFDCALRARQVIDLSMGMALGARLGAPREELLRDADDGVALFFSSN